MTVYDFFCTVSHETNLLKAMKQEREWILQSLDYIRKSKSKDLANELAIIEEKASRQERELVLCINRTMALLSYANELIESLSRPEDKAVLIERYILGHTWKQVSENTYWSISQLYIINRRAIEEIEDKHPEFSKRTEL